MNTVQSTSATLERGAKPTTGLVFPHGVANLTIRVDEAMPQTYGGEFDGPKPRVTEGDGVISIDYPRFNPLIWGRTSAVVTLSPSVAWFIEIRDGASPWDADLRSLRVASINIHGGASHVELRMPRPAGTVPIRVSGGGRPLTPLPAGRVAARRYSR